MTIIAVGDPHEFIEFVEQMAAQDHGGIKEMHYSSYELRADCGDGARVYVRRPASLRGYKANEVWIQSDIDQKLLNDLIIPMVMGKRENIHYFSEKGF